MRKVYFLIQRYYPDVTASGNLISNLIPYFSKEFDTEVVTTTANRDNLRIDDGIKRFLSQEVTSKNIVHRIFRKIVGVHIQYNLDMHHYLEQAVIDSDSPVLLVPITAPEMILALDLKMKYPSKVILMPYFLEELLEFYRSKERVVLKDKLEIHSDGIVILPKLIHYINSKNPVLITEHPMVKNNIAGDSENSRDIVYVGGLNRAYRNPKLILEAFKRIEDEKRKGYTYRFYGYGNLDDFLYQFEKELPSFKYGGSVSSLEANDLLSKAGFVLTIGNKNSALVPSKIFDCISTGNPIIHFYYHESDPYLDYLKDYPYAICQKIEDINVDELVEFIDSHIGLKVDYDIIESNYKIFTPEYVFSQCKDFIEGLYEKD